MKEAWTLEATLAISLNKKLEERKSKTKIGLVKHDNIVGNHFNYGGGGGGGGVHLSRRGDGGVKRIYGVLYWTTPWSTFGLHLDHFWSTHLSLVLMIVASFFPMEYFWTTFGPLLEYPI